MNQSDIDEKTIDKFISLLKTCSRNSPNDRIQYRIDSKSPYVSGGSVRGSGEVRKQDAYTLHVLEHAILISGSVEANARAALLYLSKLSINSSPLTVGDLASIVNLLEATDPDVCSSYLILQAMADVISADVDFARVLNKEVKTSATASTTTLKGALARQKRTISTQNTFNTRAGDLNAGATTGQYLMGIVNTTVVPVAIVNKCIDIAKRTDEIQALDAVCKLAKVLNSPLAQRMADTLKAGATNEAFAATLAGTLSVVGTGVSIGIAPSGAGLVAGGSKLGLPTSPAGGLIAPSTLSSSLFTGIKAGAQIGLKEGLKPWALGQALSRCKSPFVAPVFAVRTKTEDGEDTRFLPPQETRCYNLYDKKLVISLLAYIAVPLKYCAQKDVKSERKYNKYMARALLKNLLGSYLGEDAARPISLGMRPQDYIADKLGFWNANPLHGIEQDRKDLEDKFKKQRPPNFVRLMCVGAGLTSDDHPEGAKAKGTWKAIYTDNPKTLYAAMARNNGVWRDPSEPFFSSFKPEEKTNEGMAKSYLCRPWLADAALNDRILDNPLIKATAIFFSYPDYGTLKKGVEVKSRWERDKENPECSVCGTKAGKIFTGLSHCRCCGKIFCDTHLRTKGFDFLNPLGIKTVNIDDPKGNVFFKDEKTCDACIDHLKREGRSRNPYDRLALTEGDAVVRPMFLKEAASSSQMSIKNPLAAGSLIDIPVDGHIAEPNVRFTTEVFKVESEDESERYSTIVTRIVSDSDDEDPV